MSYTALLAVWVQAMLCIAVLCHDVAHDGKTMSCIVMTVAGVQIMLCIAMLTMMVRL